MNVEELVHYFQTHKNAHTKGSGLLAVLTQSKREDVLTARQLYRERNLSKSGLLPKVLIFDIETAPIKAYVWQLWKANVSLDAIIKDWFVLCWSAKWLYSSEVMGDCITPQEVAEEDDERVVKSLWELFDKADIVVAHNALKFDVPKMNARFIKHGLNPPSPYKIVDTKAIAQKTFMFSSNKLDALAIYFGKERKLDTDFNLWKNCLQGDQKALDYMFKYNKQDVKLLEEVYIKLFPWAKNHPNMGNYINSTVPVCSNCGTANIKLIPDKYYYTQTNKYPIYRCTECGAITRGRECIKKPKVKGTSTMA